MAWRFWRMSCRPISRKRPVMPSPIQSQTKCGNSARATAKASVRTIDARNGRKRISKIGKKAFSICGSLWSRVFQFCVWLDEPPAPQQLHCLHQRACRVTCLLLEGAIGVEREMAAGIVLVVVDIAVDLGPMSSADQA